MITEMIKKLTRHLGVAAIIPANKFLQRDFILVMIQFRYSFIDEALIAGYSIRATGWVQGCRDKGKTRDFADSEKSSNDQIRSGHLNIQISKLLDVHIAFP
jgi:hypothetical protein